MKCHHLGFGGIPTLRSPVSPKPSPRRKKANFTVYPFDLHRKRVDLWNLLFDYVRVGHRKMGDQKSSPCGHKFPTGSPEWGVSTSKVQKLDYCVTGPG